MILQYAGVFNPLRRCRAAACGSSRHPMLPRLRHHDPALADTLAPNPPASGGGPCYSVTSRLGFHRRVCCRCPDSAQNPLCVSGGAAKTPIILEAVWNRWVTVAADEALNKGRSPLGRCRGTAAAGCCQSHRALALQLAACHCLESAR
jgi:hypothetical protein